MQLQKTCIHYNTKRYKFGCKIEKKDSSQTEIISEVYGRDKYLFAREQIIRNIEIMSRRREKTKWHKKERKKDTVGARRPTKGAGKIKSTMRDSFGILLFHACVCVNISTQKNKKHP